MYNKTYSSSGKALTVSTQIAMLGLFPITFVKESTTCCWLALISASFFLKLIQTRPSLFLVEGKQL